MSVDTGDVAVVIPTFNHAHFLRAAIESALAKSQSRARSSSLMTGPATIPRRYQKLQKCAYRPASECGPGGRAQSRPGRKRISLCRFPRCGRSIPPGRARRRPEVACRGRNRRLHLWQICNRHAPTAERTRAVNTPVPKQAFAHFLREDCIGMHGTVMYRRAAIERAGGSGSI